MNRTIVSVGFCVCTGLVFVSGCGVSSNTGNQKLQAENVSKITKGVTTRSEVEGMLGAPDNVSLMPDGRRVMLYQGQQRKGDMSGTMSHAVIPFAALFPADDKSTTKRQMLQITLNADNVVQDYEFSDTTSEIKTTSSAFGAHTEQSTTPPTPPETSGK